MTRYDVSAVKSAAQGRWDAIFAALAPKLAEAQEKPGRHVPCPVHGGTDGFRLFKHYAEKGDCICNTCGARTDGFDTLRWVNGWTFAEALVQTARFLGVRPSPADNAGIPSESRRSAASESASDSQQTQRKTRPLVFEGIVLDSGMQKYGDCSAPVYTVTLMLPNGRTVACRGVELETALRAAGASRGDKVRLVKLRTEERRNSKGAYKINIWQCDMLRPARRSASVPKTEASSEGPGEAAKRRVSIERLWGIALPIRKDRTTAAPVLKYFESRGLKDARWTDESLRFVPNAIYRAEKGKKPERWPALVAAVRKADGRLVTLHRTYLTEEGKKAPVEEVKKLMALPEGETISGASIQLGKPLDRLCIAEGIETALSVQYATGLPCWCAVSANGMKTVEIPERVRTVLIFADKDKSETGGLAAEALRRRLAAEGRLAVVVQIPDAVPEGSKGLDWNDILRTKGPAAFPVRQHS